METSDEKPKTHTCRYCKKTDEHIGISTKESHFYSFDLNTHQWEDFHGSENIDSQKYFCINCNKKINNKEVSGKIN